MSHFTVVAIGETVDSLEKALEPFYEQPEMGSPYLHFEDKEDELRKEYETRNLPQRRLPNGKLVSPYDNKYEGKGEKVEVPAKEAYSTFEEFVEDWHGMSKDELTGKYGYYSNPQAKWDWWVIGGRWSGYFRVKKNAEGMLGSPGVFDNEPRDGYVDVVRKGDWDLEGQRQDAAEDAGMRYDDFHAMLAGFDMPPNWSEFRPRFDDIEAAREAYRNLPVMRHIRENDKEHRYLFVDDYQTTFGCSREEFMERAKKNVGIPFAIYYNKTWYERGSMGWWGMVSNEKDNQEWIDQVANLFDSLDEDTQLIMVDCHI